MAATGSTQEKARVLIAGGGFAALEAALGLRALVPQEVRLTLVSPDPVLHYRPAASTAAFEPEATRAYDLAEIARDIGAALHRDRVESVASRTGSVRTASGARIPYDALILAIGGRAVAAIPGALTFRDQRDVGLIRRLLDELEAGTIRRLVFAVPAGSAWPVPLYELALLTSRHAVARSREVHVSLVTPERAPLEVFGPTGSRAVGELLAAHGVQFIGGVFPGEVLRNGSLTLAVEGSVAADRVVAVPEIRGRRLGGIPATWRGLVPVDSAGRVESLTNVYAAGDMTTFHVKHGGLAAQQAERIARTIAASLGAPVRETAATHVLQARLLGAETPLLLRAELDWRGLPTAATLVHHETEPAAAGPKVFGRYLTPYLENAAARAA